MGLTTSIRGTGDPSRDMRSIIMNYERFIRQFEAATPTIIQDALMPVFNKSQIYVPKKTGKLMESGHLEVGTDEQGRPEGYITYGDDQTLYALVVHEATWVNHREPTRAKYLQSALEEEMDHFLVSIGVSYLALMA